MKVNALSWKLEDEEWVAEVGDLTFTVERDWRTTWRLELRCPQHPCGLNLGTYTSVNNAQWTAASLWLLIGVHHARPATPNTGQ